MSVPPALKTAPAQLRKPRVRPSLIVALAAAIALGYLAWRGYYVLGAGNFHTVIDGQLFRGAQPTPVDLHRLHARHGIRTVINLRGCGAPQDWYADEVRACQQLGLPLHDIMLSAVSLPSPHELRRLVELLDAAERPIFLHCRHGADRTGLASAIALMLRPEVSYTEARAQLGLPYGHMPVGRTTWLDVVFARYEAWLRTQGKTHDAAAFRTWLLDHYRGAWCRAQIDAIDEARMPQADQPIVRRLRVRNLSEEPWAFQPHATAGTHVLCRILDQHGEIFHEGRAGLLRKDLLPGEALEVSFALPRLKAGSYRLWVDVIEEGHCWFSQVGSKPYEEEWVVR